MKIWLIHIGELLPIDGPTRPFRYGILAEMLSERGHYVTRWAPTFIHAYKKHRFLHDHAIELNSYYQIKLLYTRGYDKNISLRRLLFCRQIASVFADRIKKEKPPDIILSAIPTPEMSAVSIDYAKRYHIPCVIDIRDLWPDIFLDVVPKKLRWLARLALWWTFNTNHRIFREATGIVAVSSSYLDWGLTCGDRQRCETDGIFPLGYMEKPIPKEQFALEKQNLINAGVNPEQFICCFIGQFGASYDLETIIDAARELEKDLETRVQFVLCGDGTKMPSLKKRAAGLHNVIFLSWVNYPTIAALREISDVGLASYVKDAPQSLPNKVFEYLSGGLPIISSLCGELETILAENDCGITYKAGNVQEFIEALRQLLDNPNQCQYMGNNALRIFNEQFSGERVYGRMIDYLERIVRDKPTKCYKK